MDAAIQPISPRERSHHHLTLGAYMRKNAAVAFVLLFLICSSLQSFSQAAPGPLDVRPTERVFKPIDDNERAVLTGNRHPMAIEEYSTGQLSPEKRMEHMVLVLRGNAEQEAAL